MDNTLTLKFFRVTPKRGHNIAFDRALQAALALGAPPNAREKNIAPGMPDAIIVRLERLDAENDFLSGEMIRKQVSNIPPEANDEGLSPIQLSEGGGLGLSSAFRYHLPTRVLLIQANNQAVSQTRLNRYLRSVDQNAEYEFDPVPRRDAWERFSNGLPRKLLLKIASPQHVAGLEHESDTIGTGAANIGEALRGAYITIEVSMGRKKGSLLKGATERVIRGLRRAQRDRQVDVQTLSVSVAEEGEGTDSIDFLDEHLLVRDRLDLPEKDHPRNYQIRADFLRAQFNASLEYLHQLYGPA